MRKFQRFATPIAILTILAACTADQPAGPTTDGSSISDHVTFYGVGKVARYQQHMDSSLEELGPIFFAEIFIAVGGEVTAARVRFPDRFREIEISNIDTPSRKKLVM